MPEESVLWLVLDSDFFCSLSELRSCCAFPAKACAPPPTPLKKPRTTRSGLTGVHNRLPNIPHGLCNKSIKYQHARGGVCVKNEIAVN